MTNPISGVSSASGSRPVTEGECDGPCTFMWVLDDPEGPVDVGNWVYQLDCPFEYCTPACDDYSPGSYAGELRAGTCS